jgi:hypothetical protein
MSDFDLDLVQAWAAGKLPAAQATAFEASMVEDPELAEFASAWRELDGYTQVEETHEADPDNRMRSVLTFGALEALMETPPAPWTPLLHIAAAASVALGATLGVHAGFSSDSATLDPLATSSIPLVTEADPMDPAFDQDLIALRDYLPVRAGEVQWLDSIAAGQVVANSTGRPMLLWCIHPTCPYCKKMRETTLLDPDVQDLLLQFVPVQLDVMNEQRYASMTLEHGFPMFEVVTPELADLHRFYNYREPTDFRQELIRGLQERGDGATLSWETWSAAASSLLNARAAERAGRLGEALVGYQSMAELGAGLRLSAVAERGERRLAVIAGGYLEQAQRNADPARVLGGAAWEFRGSSFGAEFRSLAQSVRDD